MVNGNLKHYLAKLKTQICIAQERDQVQSALVLLEEYLRWRPQDHRWRYEYGDALRLAGRTDEAIKIFRTVPESVIPDGYKHMIQLTLGRLYQELGQLARAEKCYRAALNKAPNYTVPVVFLAALLSVRGRYQEACDVLNDGLKRNAEGNVDEVWLNLGRFKSVLGDLETARNCYRKALRITPGYSEAKASLADVTRALRLRRRLSKRPRK